MNFSIQSKTLTRILLVPGLFVLALSALVAGTSRAAEVSETQPSFSKLQFDRNGNLYGLGPQQATLFRIQVRKTGIATQQLFSWAQRINSFAITDDGFVLVSNDSAVMLDRAGKVLRRLGDDEDADLLDRPSAVTYSGNRRIYIAEAGGDRVSVFGRDGIYLFSFGNTGDHGARLKNPFAIFVDQTEHVYVLDRRGKGRVNIFAADGQWVRSLTAESLQLAPFADRQLLAPVVDQNGNLLAPGVDSKNFIQYNWRQDKQQLVDLPGAAEVNAFAFGQDRVITETNNVVQSRELRGLAGAIGPAPILDNVTRETLSAPGCSQAYVLPAKEVLCLDQRQGSLVRYSADGKPRVRYGGKLEKPSLLAWSKNRLAIVDNNGLKLFQLSGSRINQSDQFKKPQALGFAGDRLVLIQDGKMAILNPDGSLRAEGDPGAESSISRRTRFMAIDSAQNIYAADRNDKQVHVYNLQSHQAYLVSPPEISRIKGLSVDGSDQLYVLAKHKDGGLYIHVLRGMSERFRFRVGSDFDVEGFSVIPAADSLLSIYDKHKSTFRQFQYQQVPSRVINLRTTAGADGVAFTWLRSAEPYANHYIVQAATTREGPFTEVASTSSSQLDLRLVKKRYRYFRISSVARSGITGYPSQVIDNLFEPAYADYLQKEYVAAIEKLRGLSQTEPENAAALEYLGRSLVAIGHFDQALIVLGQLQTLEDQSPVRSILQAEALYGAGRFSEANEVIGNTKSGTRVSAERSLVCARIKLALDDKKGAQGCLKNLITTQPGNIEARFLALNAYEPKRDRTAIRSQLQWLSNEASKNKNVETMVSLANYFLDHGKFSDAEKWFQGALKIEPARSGIHAGLVRVAMKQKHFSKARSIALTMIGKSDQQVEGYRLLGNVAFDQGRPGEAVLSYRKAASQEPSNMAVQFGLARAFRALKNYSQAKDALSSVLRANPFDAEAHFEMAQINQAEGEPREAIQELYKTLQFEPQNRTAREMLLSSLESAGRLHEATIEALALEHIHPSVNHTRTLADLYYKQGRYRPALERYLDLLKRNRNSVELNVRVGTIYHRLGQNILARKVLEKAVRLDRNAESAQSVLAQVYSDLRFYTAAIRAANTALKQQPGADNRLLLESIKSDRDDYLKNKKHGTSLVIDKFVLTPVYATALADEKISIGSVSITNRSQRDVSDITLRVYIGDFVDAGMVMSIPVIKAKASVEIPLATSLYSHIDEFAEDQVKNVDVELGFSDQHGSRLVQKEGILSIYGQHAVEWDSARSLKHFLQVPGSTDRLRLDSLYEGATTHEIFPVYLSPLIGIYSNISGHGISIKRQPESEKHYLQYPAETLARHRGSFADIALLFASFLESGGNHVALAASIGDPLLLVDTGTSWDQRDVLGLQDSVIYNHGGKAWIPLAMNRWPSGIRAMWSTGSRLISGLKEKVTLIELGSVSGPLSTVKISGSADPGWDPAWVNCYRQRQFYALQPYLMANSAAGVGTGSLLQQAQWYLQNKYYRHALKAFSAVLEENPYSYDATIGSGEAQTGLNERNSAVDFFRRASYLEPFDKVSADKVQLLLKQLRAKSLIDNTNGKLVH
jgi:tetratricopeptide (TPR) repeat protein